MASATFERLDKRTLEFFGQWTMAEVTHLYESLAKESFECADLAGVKQIDSAGLAVIITALLKSGPQKIELRHCPVAMKPLVELYDLEPYLANSL